MTEVVCRAETLDAALVDAITEAVVWTPTAAGRAEVVARIVECAVEAVRWRLQPVGEPVEELSLQHVVHAATGHRDRMVERER